MSSTWYRFLALGLGLVHLGKQKGADLTKEALNVVAEPLKTFAITLLDVCAYTGEETHTTHTHIHTHTHTHTHTHAHAHTHTHTHTLTHTHMGQAREMSSKYKSCSISVLRATSLREGRRERVRAGERERAVSQLTGSARRGRNPKTRERVCEMCVCMCVCVSE